MPDATGHWITLDGRHIFIDGAAGSVPMRLHPSGEKTRFSKAELQRHILQHHSDVGGRGTYTAADEKTLNDAAGAGDPFTFHKKLPTEVKEFMAGRPELRSMFRVSEDAGKAGGADAFGELGDRYLDIAEAKAGSPLRAAVKTAHASHDPEVKFLAAIHDNLPEGRFSGDTIESKGLRVGDQFTIGGSKFRVAEDDHGLRVLEGGKDYPETPVDAIRQLPIDKGSFRPGKSRKQLEVAPFSQATNQIIYLSAPGDFTPFPGALEGRPREVAGQPCFYFWKDLIGIDNYANSARNFVMSVPSERLEKWERTGNEMVAAGINIPIVEDHVETAESSRGRIVEFEIRKQGNSPKLYGLCQLIGEDAPLLAARNQVSVGVPFGDYVTGGRNWGDAIRHVALTPVPAVHGQQPFIQAASQPAADAGAIVTLAAMSTQRSDPMKTLKCSEDVMSALHDTVPGLKDIPDDDKLAHINGHLQTMHAGAKEDAGYGDDGDADADAPAKIAKMSAAELYEAAGSRRDNWRLKLVDARKLHATSQTKIQELSTAVAAATPRLPDTRTLFLLSQAIETERAAAIAAGGVDAETVKKIDGILSKNGKPTILAMSQDSEESPMVGMEVWRALKGNKPDTSKLIATGIQSMSNAVTMGSVADAAKAEAEKKVSERMLAAANGTNQ